MADSNVAHRDDAPAIAKIDDEQGRDLAAEQIGTVESSVVGRSVTINRPLAEVFAYWRDFGNLASFMENVVRVDPIDAKRSHWVVKAPAGKTVEWDAVVTDEQTNAYIVWHSSEGADVANGGRIDFRDAGARGTVVSALISYDPPAGVIGKIIAKIFQREPAIQARRDLRRFKQLMETGEIATAARTRAMRNEEID
jgi:uncharacterized membrane protein